MKLACTAGLEVDLRPKHDSLQGTLLGTSGFTLAITHALFDMLLSCRLLFDDETIRLHAKNKRKGRISLATVRKKRKRDEPKKKPAKKEAKSSSPGIEK